jgi:hypothetical protein
MSTEILLWDMYEIIYPEKIQGVMFRGRIRKFGLEQGITLLAENATDIEGAVRFAVLHSTSVDIITEYIMNIMKNCTISCILKSIPNPVLSKLKVNKEERYTL